MLALPLEPTRSEPPPLRVEPVLRELTQLAVLSAPEVIDAQPAVNATALAITIPRSAQSAENVAALDSDSAASPADLPSCDQLHVAICPHNCKPSRCACY
jgi:hypothetical protein